MLPEAVQPFGIDAAAFLAGVDSMIDRVGKLAESLDVVISSAKAMSDSLSASAAKADEGLTATTDAAERLTAAGEAVTGQVAAVADGLDGVAAAAGRSAEGLTGQADAEKGVGDSAAFAAGLLADLQKQQETTATTAGILADALAAEARAMKLAGDAAVLAGDETAVAGDESVAAAGKMDVARDSAVGMGGAMKTALLGTAIALGYGIDKAGEFQSSMEQLHTQAGVAQGKLAGLSQGVMKLAGQVGEGPQSLSESLYHVASNLGSAGVSGAQMLNAVRVAAEGAQVGNANLVDVTNALGAAIASGIPGVQNYSQAMAYMNATVGAGDMSMQNLADAFGTGVLANIKMYGVTLRDVAAALATFGDNNIRGAKAGTDLRMAVQAMVAPLTTAGPALAKLGLSSTSLADAMKNGGLNSALDLFISKLHDAKVSSKDYGEMITDIFGKKAGSGIGVLVGEFSKFQGKYKQVQSGADSFASDWTARTKTMAQQWDDLKSGAQAMAISFGTVLLPAATKVVGALAKFAGFLEKHPAIAAFAGAVLALGVAFKVAATMEALFDALDPFTLILVGVVALSVGLYELYTHFKVVRDIVADVGKFLASAWADAIKAAGAVTTWFVNGPLAWIKAQLQLFAGFWAQHGQEIEEIASTVWHAVSSVVTEAWRLLWDMGLRPGLVILEATWRVVWGIVRDTVVGAWRNIGAVVAAGVHLILDVIGIALDLLTGHWSQAWSDCKKLVHDAIYGISNIINTFTSTALTLLVDAGKNIIRGLINGIKSMAGGAWDAIKSVGSGLLHSAESVFGIASPSKVFYAMGGMLTQGLADGINATAGVAYAAARTLAANVAALASEAAAGDTTIAALRNAAATGHATISALPTPAAITSSAIVSALPTPTPAQTAAASMKAALAAMGAGSAGGGGGGGGAGGGGYGSGGSDPYTTAAKKAAKAVATATAAQAAEYAKIGAGITERIGAGITETIPQAQIAALKLTEAVRRELADHKITSAEASELTTKIQEDLTARAHRLVKAMQQIGLEMRAGLLSSLENAATRAQANSAVTKLIDYVKQAWSAGDISLSKASSMTAWLTADNDRLQNLAQKRQALEAKIKAADAYANTTTSNTESWAGLSNITSSMTSGGMVYSGNILAGMKTDLSTINQFSSAIKRLGREGLSKNLLNQLIQMGPQQGLQVATALLDGPLSVIKSMNATQSAINSASSGLGQTAANLLYDSGAQAGKGFLSGLQGQMKSIEKAMDQIAESMVKTIERDLKIHSPSLVTTEHGEMIAMGLVNGLEHGVPWVKGAMHALSGAATPGGGNGVETPGLGGGGNTTYQFNVTVTGGWIGSEQELVEELRAKLQGATLRYDRRNGNNGLTLQF